MLASCSIEPFAESGHAGLDQDNARIPVRVEQVIDGDTFQVTINGLSEHVRMIGMDTPETAYSPGGAEPYGAEASRYTKERLEGRDVLLEYDTDKRDKYGRLLAYVWLDGQLFNEDLVRQGWGEARSYPPNIRYQKLLDQAENEARIQKRGMWR